MYILIIIIHFFMQKNVFYLFCISLKNAFKTELSEKTTKKYKWARTFFLGPLGKNEGHFYKANF